MSTVHQKFTGDASQLEKEIEKLRKQHVRLEEQMVKGAKEAAKGQDIISRSIDRAGTTFRNNIIGMVASTVSFRSALSLVTSELERQKQLADESRFATLKLAEAQAGMVRNLGPNATKADIAFMESGLAKISTDTGVSQAALSVASGAALSGAQGNKEIALAVVGEVAKILADSPSEMAEIANKAPGIMTAMGTDDPKTALAWMQAVMGVAPLVKPEAFKHYSKAIASGAVTQKGVDFVEATSATGALLSGIGIRLTDDTGELTKSAVNRLQTILEQVIPEQMSHIERVRRIQESPSLQKKAMEAFGTQNEQYPIIRELLTDKNSIVSRLVEGALPQLTASQESFRNLQANLVGGTEALKIAQESRLATTNIESQKLDPTVAGQSNVRDILDKALRETVPGGTGSLFSGWEHGIRMAGFDIWGKTPDIAIEALQERERDIRNQANRAFGRAGELPDAEQKMIDTLEKAIEQLRRIEANTASEPDNRGAPQRLMQGEPQ